MAGRQVDRQAKSILLLPQRSHGLDVVIAAVHLHVAVAVVQPRGEVRTRGGADDAALAALQNIIIIILIVIILIIGLRSVHCRQTGQ